MFLFDLQLCVVFWRQRLTSLVTDEEGCVSGSRDAQLGRADAAPCDCAREGGEYNTNMRMRVRMCRVKNKHNKCMLLPIYGLPIYKLIVSISHLEVLLSLMELCQRIVAAQLWQKQTTKKQVVRNVHVCTCPDSVCMLLFQKTSWLSDVPGFKASVQWRRNMIGIGGAEAV